MHYTSRTMGTAGRHVRLTYAVPEQDERWVLDDEAHVPESPLHAPSSVFSSPTEAEAKEAAEAEV